MNRKLFGGRTLEADIMERAERPMRFHRALYCVILPLNIVTTACGVIGTLRNAGWLAEAGAGWTLWANLLLAAAFISCAVAAIVLLHRMKWAGRQLLDGLLSMKIAGYLLAALVSYLYTTSSYSLAGVGVDIVFWIAIAQYYNKRRHMFS